MSAKCSGIVLNIFYYFIVGCLEVRVDDAGIESIIVYSSLFKEHLERLAQEVRTFAEFDACTLENFLQLLKV